MQTHLHFETSFAPSMVLWPPEALQREGGHGQVFQAVDPVTCVFGLVPLKFVPHLHPVSDLCHALTVVRYLALAVQGLVVGSLECFA